METDFLNFHDEEHFGSGLYQSELLDDSQSSILDIVGDEYSRQDSAEYLDNSVIWDQEVEREINGDVAVIPMSGSINSFPKLSNSPPTKDMQRIFCDWQEHLASIGASDNEDLSVDLHLPGQNLVVDMLDYITPITTQPTLTAQSSLSDITSIDSSQIQIPNQPKIVKCEPTSPKHINFPSTSKIDFETEQKFKKKDIKPPVRTGGKNLELLKAVVKEELELDSSFKNEFPDELDSANDSFDIASYVIGQDYLEDLEKKSHSNDRNRGHYEKHMPDEFEEKSDIFVSGKSLVNQDIKTESNFNGYYEKVEVKQAKKEIKKEVKGKIFNDDSEEDHIDVETVSEHSEMPVLEARDLTHLLEQFEASEALKPKLPDKLFDSDPKTNKNDIKILKKEPEVKVELKTEPKITKPEVKTNKTMNKNIRDSLPMELIQKIKASGHKKSISVIPAMPTKKARGSRGQEQPIQNRNKLLKLSSNESIQLDHDYCSVSPSKVSRNHSRRNSSDSDANNSRKKSPDRKKFDKLENGVEDKKQIDDTAIRIEKQIKNAISKHKNNMSNRSDSILKYQPTIKNANGQLMVSLLKTNRNINNTIVNTVNTNDEQIKNIIVDETKNNSKKRKLNLEEYKRLRGEILKSCDNSGANSPNSGISSPMPQTSQSERDNEEKVRQHQELMMKMASEILKTPAKSNKVLSDAKLEEFVPPEARQKEDKAPKPPESKPQQAPEPISPPKPAEDYELITIVSIGVNTDEVKIEKKAEQKIMFKLNKKDGLQKNKFFESETEESPKKEPAVDKTKLTQIITPILQNASAKINSNSLITNITATLLQKSPKISPKYDSTQKCLEISKISPKYDMQKPNPKISPKYEPQKADVAKKPEEGSKTENEQPEHGEDKTVIVLHKNRTRPAMKSIEVQTDDVVFEEVKEKPARQYRSRRDSSSSSSASNSSIKCKSNTNIAKNGRDVRRQNHRTSSSNSLSSSLGSRWSRSRSRSRSRSHSVYSQSSYYSASSRSRSRSMSPSRRWHTNRNSRSRHRYSRTRRRSRSRSRSNDYRNSYRRSRSPYSRSHSRKRREQEQEKLKEVEERRVIYVGKISDGTTKADLRRRFQSFGPITNVSVHFRDHGDNYGFVTFAYKVDAYEAVEHGNDEPHVPKYDISFGGRRAFCKTRYSDLDNIEAEAMNPTIFRREEDSFDILLREAQAKLRKRKV